ncbi:HAD family hydrolase [Carboxylicivirga sp. N1Y90]|uniref:HAD family hydrolase n=1 Tax=Carboxylicivirga fragile TaxID=3417571 RepID=UPI003D341CCA|nr:HAD family phosphatase [Marinilabiliaceae bacterium N1Y90]
MIQNIKAVFFDMDGVLYDSMPNHEYTWIESFKTIGIDFPSEEAYLNEGRTGHSTIRNAIKKYLNREATIEEENRIYEFKTNLMQRRPKAPILPYMQELHKHLRSEGIDIFVVTGSRQPSLINKLADDFDVAAENIVSAKDVKQGKPHPEPYLIALDRSGFDAKNCIVVENAPLGVESAKAAGLYTVAVNTGKLNGKVLLDAGADHLCHTTKELFDLLTQSMHLK